MYAKDPKKLSSFIIGGGQERGLRAGTESISALSIFSSSVLQLNKYKTNFVFATHLHELCNIEEITHGTNADPNLISVEKVIETINKLKS